MENPNLPSNAQCTDVLLSFLSDVGEDWSDSFIFPGSEVSHYVDIDDYLSKEEFQEHYAMKNSPIKQSSSSSNVSSTIVNQGSQSVDVEDFDKSINNLFSPFADDEGLLTLDDMFAAVSKTTHFSPPAFVTTSGTVGVGIMNPSTQSTQRPFKLKPEYILPSSQIGLKRKRNVEPMIEDPRDIKATVPHKVTAVCSMLNQYRAVKRESEERDRKMAKTGRFRYATPIDTATTYLQSLFNSKPVPPQEFLKLSSSSSVLHCKALSSLVTNSQSKKALAKLSAWMPPNSVNATGFPENHTGIGQTAAASRSFTSAMNDVLGHTLMSKLRFHVTIPRSSAIVSKYGDRLCAPFVFKSEGMISMGYAKEIEFNGSITCDFVREGINHASVYFDAFKIIRDQHEFVKPLSTVAAML